VWFGSGLCSHPPLILTLYSICQLCQEVKTLTAAAGTWGLRLYSYGCSCSHFPTAHCLRSCHELHEFSLIFLTFVSIRAIRGEMPPGETRAFTPYSYCPLTHRGRAENPQGRSVALVAALTGCWGRDDTRQLQAERVQSSRGGRPPCRPQPGLPVGSKTRPTRVCAILYRGSPESRDDLPPTEEACLSWQAS